MEKILSDGFAALGITPDAEAVGRLQAYYEYLEERNKVMNLTAINGLEDVARLHFRMTSSDNIHPHHFP